MVSHEKNKITWGEYSTGPQTIILGLYIFLAVQDSTEWQYQNFDRKWYRDLFPIPNFPKPKPRFFFRDQIFQTDNDTFPPRPNSPKQKSILFFREQIFRKPKPRPKPNSPRPIPKPSKNWQKSRDRDRNWNRDFSISLTILGKIFSKYFPHFPSPFFFSSRKKIFPFPDYFPPFSSPFLFSSGKKIFPFPDYFPPFSSPFFFSSGIEHQR